MASEVDGFRTIRVKFSEKNCSYHLLYCKKNILRLEDTERPSDKTLFVVNIPPYFTKGTLRCVFSCCGPVKHVFLMKKPGAVEKEKESLVFGPNRVEGFKVGYVVFKRSSSLNAALELDISTVQSLSTKKHTVVTGMKKWTQEYHTRYPDPTKLQAEVDKYMAKFDKEKEKIKKQWMKTRNQPDEEGWITVGRGRRNLDAPRNNATGLRERKGKKKKQPLLNFYQFQQRETRREHIAHLRKKFEEDKKKIAEMKSARRFRPY